MNRRTLLAAGAAGVAAGVGGHLGVHDRVGASGSSADERADGGNEDADVGLRVLGVYADDADREFFDGEFVLFENASEAPLNVSGYVVEYPSEKTYRIRDLVLEPNARLAVFRRQGDDATLEMSPPFYLRYAGFDADPPASVLGENGTVRVRNRLGATVVAADYETFGCDGGTGVDGSDGELECPY